MNAEEKLIKANKLRKQIDEFKRYTVFSNEEGGKSYLNLGNLHRMPFTETTVGDEFRNVLDRILPIIRTAQLRHLSKLEEEFNTLMNSTPHRYVLGGEVISREGFNETIIATSETAAREKVTEDLLSRWPDADVIVDHVEELPL